LDAEMAQRRRFFNYQASLQKDGLEKSILEKQQTRQKLEHQQKWLHNTFQEQLGKLVARYAPKDERSFTFSFHQYLCLCFKF